MIRRPPRSTRTDTLFPYTSLFRSLSLGLPAAQRFRTEPATILPDRKALVVRTASNGGQLMAIAIDSLPHLDRITSPETALQSYRIALQKDGVTLDLGGTLSAATKDRLDRVSVPVGNTGIMLMLRVKDAPVNVARSLSVFLPLLM